MFVNVWANSKGNILSGHFFPLELYHLYLGGFHLELDHLYPGSFPSELAQRYPVKLNCVYTKKKNVIPFFLLQSYITFILVGFLQS